MADFLANFCTEGFPSHTLRNNLLPNQTVYYLYLCRALKLETDLRKTKLKQKSQHLTSHITWHIVMDGRELNKNTNRRMLQKEQ